MHSSSESDLIDAKICIRYDEKAYEFEKVTATEQTNALTIITKNRIATRAANPTPIQTYHCHPHQMPRPWMPNAVKRIHEKAYEFEKVTATEETTNALTIVTKNRIVTRAANPTPIQR